MKATLDNTIGSSNRPSLTECGFKTSSETFNLVTSVIVIIRKCYTECFA
jgi:hypothetical protein